MMIAQPEVVLLLLLLLLRLLRSARRIWLFSIVPSMNSSAIVPAPCSFIAQGSSGLIDAPNSVTGRRKKCAASHSKPLAVSKTMLMYSARRCQRSSRKPGGVAAWDGWRKGCCCMVMVEYGSRAGARSGSGLKQGGSYYNSHSNSYYNSHSNSHSNSYSNSHSHSNSYSNSYSKIHSKIHSNNALAPKRSSNGWRASPVAMRILVKPSASMHSGACTVALRAVVTAAPLRPSISALTCMYLRC